MIKKLYQQSFKREHYKGGFRAAGLSPFSWDAIPTSKLEASIPFQEPEVDPSNECTPHQEAECQEAEYQEAEYQEAEYQKAECTPHQEATTCNKCGCQVTTVELTVAAYFSKYLQCQNKPRQRDNRRVKPVAYGEVLTRDEVVQRLEQEELEKAEKAAEKAREKAVKEMEKAEKAAEKAARQAERAEEREARRVQKEAEKEAKRMEREAKKAEKEALKAAKMAQRPRQGGRKVTDVEDDDEDMFGSMFNDERDQEISKYPSICMTMFDDLI